MTQSVYHLSICTSLVEFRSNRLEAQLPFSIRRMELADLDQVVVLDRLSFSLPWPESSFKYEIENNPVSRCWVIEIEDSLSNRVLVGMIVIWLIVDEAHVATFSVHPDYRRRKIAQRLLRFTLLDAYHSGATRSFLEVRRGNLAARNLYKRFGYEEVGVRKHYYKDNGEDAILMNLEEIDPDYLESLE